MLEKIKEVLTETPGLTGREIARKIGGAKKEVNSYLASHNEGLVKRGWKWFIAEGNVKVLELPGETWITDSLFEAAFAETGCFLSSQDCSLIIRFPLKCKVLLIAGARIIALANQCALAKRDITLDFERCSKTKDYLDRLGFFDHLLPDVKVVPERPEDSRAKRYSGNSDNLVEVASIDLSSFDDELPAKLTRAFAKHAGEDYYMAAFTVFSELISNIQDHSHTPIPGFAALQLYGGARKHIQTVVSDSGLGIAATLKPSLQRFYPSLAASKAASSDDFDAFLVKKALTVGGLSQFGSDPEVARGLGLKRSQDYAVKYNAEITVRQEVFSLVLKYKRGKWVDSAVEQHLPKILGTQVCFDFFIN